MNGHEGNDVAARSYAHTDPEPYPLAEPDKSLGELVGRLTSNFSALVKDHIDLAKVEIKEEVSQAGKGAGFLGGGALAGYLAVALLSFALAWGLAELMPAWLGFLIVGVLWAAVAAVLAMTGRNKLREVEPAPRQTMDELKEDRRWLSEQKN